MQVRLPVQWLRRLLAQVTTPLLPALYWWATLASDRNAESLSSTILLCYLAWVFLGAPVALLQRPARRPPWYYSAVAAALPFLSLSMFGIGWRSGDWSLYEFVPVCGLAGLWYWFCAYWRLSRSGGEAREPA